jgi:hypothetical protein
MNWPDILKFGLLVLIGFVFGYIAGRGSRR